MLRTTTNIEIPHRQLVSSPQSPCIPSRHLLPHQLNHVDTFSTVAQRENEEYSARRPLCEEAVVRDTNGSGVLMQFFEASSIEVLVCWLWLP